MICADELIHNLEMSVLCKTKSIGKYFLQILIYAALTVCFVITMFTQQTAVIATNVQWDQATEIKNKT